MLNHVAELLAKRSEGFIRAEIMDQGRAIHGVSKEDNDITREVHNIKHFTAQAVATMESATRTIGKRIMTILRRIILYLSYRWPVHKLSVSQRTKRERRERELETRSTRAWGTGRRAKHLLLCAGTQFSCACFSGLNYTNDENNSG